VGVKGDTISETVPATLRHTTILAVAATGSTRPSTRRYLQAGARLPQDRLRGLQSALKAVAAGRDSLKLSLYLADPNFRYESGVSTLRVRILNGGQRDPLEGLHRPGGRHHENGPWNGGHGVQR